MAGRAGTARYTPESTAGAGVRQVSVRTVQRPLMGPYGLQRRGVRLPQRCQLAVCSL